MQEHNAYEVVVVPHGMSPVVGLLLLIVVSAVEVGDPVVIPELAVCLRDRELSEITHEAMWHLFMQQ